MLRHILPLVGLLALWASVASVLAAEPWIAVIVPADTSRLPDADDLQLIFERKKIYDDRGARLQPVNLPAQSSLRRRFSRAILRQAPEAMDDYWNQMYFQGVLPPHVVESEAGVVRFVAQTPHAIGYVQACATDARLRVVLLIDPEGDVRPPGTSPPCATPEP